MNTDKRPEESEAADQDQGKAEGEVPTLEKPQETSESDPATETAPAEPLTDDVVKPEDAPKDEAGSEAATGVEPTENSEEKGENKAETGGAALAQEPAVMILEAVDEPAATEAPSATEPAIATEAAVVDPTPAEKLPEVDSLLVVEAMKRLSAASQTDSGKTYFIE